MPRFGSACRRPTLPSNPRCAARIGCTTISSVSIATRRRSRAGTTWCSRMTACRTCWGRWRGLWAELGAIRTVTRESKSHHQAQAAALGAKGLVLLAPGKDETFIVKTLAIDTPGTLSPTEYRAMIGDLVNYLDYMAEPGKNKRIRLGLVVLLYLAVLLFFTYWLKREYWKDVH